MAARRRKRRKSITEIFEEGTLIDRALRKAVREALLLHKRMGHSIVVWKDGRIRRIPPDKIDV